MDPLEDRVRHLLSDDSWQVDVDTDSALRKVRQGAKRRRVRRNIGVGIASVLVVAGGAGGVGYLVTGLQDREVTVASDNGDPQVFGERQEQSGQPESGAAAPAPAQSAPSPGATDREFATKDLRVGFSAVSFTAAGPDRFWVLGAETDDTAKVLTTTDGGTSFSTAGTVDAPVAAGTNELTPDSVDSIRFAVDGENGWAYGRALWATHDGGRTWTKDEELSGKVERLEVASGRVVALAKDGDTWTAWGSPIEDDVWSKLDVELSDPGDLAVVGSTVVISDRSEVEGVIAASADGGETFSRTSSPCAPDLSAGTLSVTADSVWLTCPTGTAASINVSHDGGRTWEAVDTKALPNDLLVGARTSTQTIVAVPGSVRIVSDDGGSETVPVEGLGQPTFAGFTNERVGYVLDLEGKLFRTSDGGRSWSQVSF